MTSSMGRRSNSGSMYDGDRPFSGYIREVIRRKGLTQQEVFIAADISETYGYKLISGEKRTRQRDLIIKLCLSSKMDLTETQRALRLYGMSPLYPKIPRDAALIVAVNSGMFDISSVNALLAQNGMEPLSEDLES